MDYIYSILEFIAGVGSDFKHFLFGIPSFFMDMFAYAWFWAIKLWLEFKIAGVELAYKVTTMLLQDYEVYTVLNGAFNQLSPEYRAICHAIGIVEAIRIIIDAFATALVLRIMGW